MEFAHIPVLLKETIDSLHIRPDGIYVDGTAGGGGHSEEIAKRLIGGRLLAIDRDPAAVEAASKRLAPYPQAKVVRGNYSDMIALAAAEGLEQVDGILLDIGVSSYQLDEPERGFSFHADAPLDMRMSQSGESAADLVNRLSERELADIFFQYGEEKFSRRIAASICEARTRAPIQTTGQLAELICESVPAAARREGHPARKCFQALRIAVNGELDELSEGLNAAKKLLAVGGIVSVITFHSLEDRMVKQAYAKWYQGCICPPDFPICVCGRTPLAEPVTRKAVTASENELENNPRSRSAKLRAARKIRECIDSDF